MSGLFSRIKGLAAERAACDFLKGAGFCILEKNFRSRFGEIDIVAREGDTLVFVEVKARSSSGYGSAFEAVDRRKQQKILRTALFYISRNLLDDPYLRFDVISVNANGQCFHIPDAFGPEE
ncbi:putative endonuclease [Desulfobotulus alkaliphilus]|uniref:UPF0102 protein LZ24_01359 n=1 Tax=Desulfobotulus alkaliphilus TaxID=622671 RepID=A0A562RXW8_9BACT|nr:YraN family protein [Desulfobotulus alkaliphilus]TWI73270.1 putative endonuclease [Desulfobotulus alkaliphilus]